MAKKKTMNHWNTVTPFSKGLAIALFITLPFLGFYLGMAYQRMITVPTVETIKVPAALLNPSVSPKPMMKGY